MKFAKKVAVAIDVSDDSEKLLKAIKGMDFLSHCEIHFVHIFNSISYSTYFTDFPLLYPIEADRKLIKESVESFLSNISKQVLPTEFSGKVSFECLFSENPKAHFSDYVNENHFDLVIVATRAKRGLFESSFAQYINSHTKANMILLKNS